MATVSLKNVCKSYPGGKSGEIAAANDVSLEIADGEFVVLAGPAGAGKSTMLRMIAGLEEISRGEILIGDKRVNDLPPQERDIAMVFRNGALYPHMSVYDNMAFGLKLRNFGQPEIKKRVQEAAAILGLETLLDRKPSALSAAQRYRAALGRAIVRQPKLFLLDDPLSSLDGRLRAEARTDMTKLHQRLETTMIYATRDPVEAMSMADRIIVMNQAAVQQNDAPATVYNSPANLFVAGFLGLPPMNLLHGTLKQERDALLFSEAEDGTIQVRLPASEWASAREFIGKPVVFGIRPEDIEAAEVTKGQESARTTFPAIVEVVEPTGTETTLYLQTGAHTVVCRNQRALTRSEAGRRMQFQMNVTNAHLFDPASTRRIV